VACLSATAEMAEMAAEPVPEAGAVLGVILAMAEMAVI
jgi:hypothetical protein